MTLDPTLLNTLCPMHAVVSASGHIVQAGPTLCKLRGDANLVGARFLEVFELVRPRGITDMPGLLAAEGRKLQLRLRAAPDTELKGLLALDGRGGAVVNLSFGITVVDAVRDHRLTATDFAATDLAVEMLYLVEAKSAAFEASRTLNRRLQGAMLEAEERAFTDTLTGLRNRRAMDHVLDREIGEGNAFALMHLDLDLFKQVNDTHGHAAGDHVLQHVARIMQAETRKDDVVARVGGDEFVLILHGFTDRVRLSDLARRLIMRIERPILYDGVLCHVSTSIGIACFADLGPVRGRSDDQDAGRLLEEADIALYAAKRAGRAQYAFFDGATGRPKTARRA